MRIEIAALAFAVAVAIGATGAYAENPRTVPAFQVDPFWPKPLPNNWILGQVAGLATDRYDRIWVVHRPASLTARAGGRAEPTGGEMLCRRAARPGV